MSIWYVYIIECADTTYYTGISNDVDKRIEAHNCGKGAKYTSSRKPVILRYQKACGDRSKASKEEYRIKQLSRSKKEKLINKV
jgi:putative endonuclease